MPRPTDAPGATSTVPRHLRPALRDCAQGEAPNMALMRIFAAARDAPEARAALTAALAEAGRANSHAARRLRAALALWDSLPGAFDAVQTILALAREGDVRPAPEAFAGVFDRAAAISPEASVALYSLGSPGLLAALTEAIVARMQAWDLVAPDRLCLDVGCGIGRMLAALAPVTRAVVGLDVAEGMLAAARVRCQGQRNVWLLRGSGRDLAAFADASFDLVYVIDAFPYIVACGPELAAAHWRDAGRILKPGGSLLILNYSYRNDLAADRCEVASLGRQAGLGLLRCGTRDFPHWDGASFLLRRPPPEG